MRQEIESYHDELVPGAADRAEKFIGGIQSKCAEEGIGIELRPHKSWVEQQTNRLLKSASKPRLVLYGRIRVGSTFRKSRPMQLEVFAEPIGSSLQVGWHVTKEVAGGVATGLRSVAIAEGMKDRRDYSANNQRQLNAILAAFNKTVFEPVLEKLLNDVAREPRGSDDSRSGL